LDQISATTHQQFREAILPGGTWSMIGHQRVRLMRQFSQLDGWPRDPITAP
jgi:hypothetical protein